MADDRPGPHRSSVTDAGIGHGATGLGHRSRPWNRSCKGPGHDDGRCPDRLSAIVRAVRSAADRPEMRAAVLPPLLREVLGRCVDPPLPGLRGQLQTSGDLRSGELLTDILGLGKLPRDRNDLLLDGIQIRLLSLLLGQSRSGLARVGDRGLPYGRLTRRAVLGRPAAGVSRGDCCGTPPPAARSPVTEAAGTGIGSAAYGCRALAGSVVAVPGAE